MRRADEPTVDVAAYLARIGHAAPVHADLATLRALLKAHTATIPFENLDPFLGRPVQLDLASVQHKLITAHRGGYCFEQNLLLGTALGQIGFAVTFLAARVLWGRADSEITARTHMLLGVRLAGRTWIADAGFGSRTPTGPLRLTADSRQATPHETYRLQRPADGDWRLQVHVDRQWRTLYRFDLQPQYPVDYLAANYWLSTRSESSFVANLVAARAATGVRYALRNRELAAHADNGTTTRRHLRTTAEIREALAKTFLIRLPDVPGLDRRLARVPRQ